MKRALLCLLVLALLFPATAAVAQKGKECPAKAAATKGKDAKKACTKQPKTAAEDPAEASAEPAAADVGTNWWMWSTITLLGLIAAFVIWLIFFASPPSTARPG